MNRLFNKLSEPAYAILRIIAGLLFASHGAQKLFGVLGGTQSLSDPWMLSAGIIEFFGGILIALGLGTRFAAFIASGEMAVAYFRVHAPAGFWPIQNHGELAAIYAFLFLYIAVRGAGPFGLDALLRIKRRK